MCLEIKDQGQTDHILTEPCYNNVRWCNAKDWLESSQMGQVMRKRVLCYMRTTKVQISLRIRAVWSAPLLFAA